MLTLTPVPADSLYRTYFRPKATSAEIVRVSHYFICFWAVWAGCWSTIVRLSPSVRILRTFPLCVP